MDDFSSGVSESASVLSSGASSAPMATDSGGVQEATPAPGPGAEVTTAQRETQEPSGDAPAQEAEIDPFEADVAQIPEHQRDKFKSLLDHKKSLEKDLKALRGQWQTLADQYGDPSAIAERLAQLDGLGTYATDDVGQYVVDPTTGVPQFTTAPWLQKIAEGSPGLLDQLMYDLWSQQSPSGQTYGAQAFWQAFRELGLDPSRVNDYVALPSSQVAASQQPSAQELQYIQDEFHETYAKLTKPEREFVQGLVADLKDEDAHEYLRAARQRAVNEERLAAFDQYQKQQEQAQTQQFWNAVSTATDQALMQANHQALASLNQQIASQVQFSSDPTTNEIQSNMVSALIVALVSPDTRFAMQPIMDAVGITIDPQIDQLRANVAHAQKVYQTYAAMEQHEQFKQHRNAHAMREAQIEATRAQQQVLAKLAPVALKIAKAIASGNQGIREASQQDLAKITSRPTVGNGTLSSATSGKPTYPRGKEFDFSYRPQ